MGGAPWSRLIFAGLQKLRRKVGSITTHGAVALAFAANQDRRSSWPRTTKRSRAAKPLIPAFKSLVVLYRASNDYKKLADSTRKNWSPWLDRVSEYFGELRIAQFERPEKIRPAIRAGAISGPISLVLLIMGCRFYPASFPTR